MNKIQLIIAVKNYPELFMPKHLRYNDEKRKDSIWEAIGMQLEQSAKKCRLSWKKIIENYIFEMREHGFTCKSELKFLAPYYKDLVIAKGKNGNALQKEYMRCAVLLRKEKKLIPDDKKPDVVVEEMEPTTKIYKKKQPVIRRINYRNKLEAQLDEGNFKCIDKKLLLYLIGQNPLLYENRLKEFASKKKVKLWNDVAELIDCGGGTVTGFDCAEAWKILKRFYCSYADDGESNFKYESEMAFYRPAYEFQKARPRETAAAAEEARLEKRQFNLRVISAVRKFPELWDTRHNLFYNSEKSTFWNSVARKTNFSADASYNAWRNIRRMYFKHLSDIAEKKNSTFDLAEEMDFLKSTIQTAGNADLLMIPDENIRLEIQVVRAVKNYPVLYEPPANSMYLNDQLEDFWKTIEKDIKVPAKICKETWYKTRQSFIDFLRRRETHPKAKRRKFRLAHEIEFLLPWLSEIVSPEVLKPEEPPLPKKSRRNQGIRTRVDDSVKLKVIEAVRKCPKIYSVPDIKEIKYHERKGPLWQAISEEIGIPPQNCERIWVDLRNSYKKYLERKNDGQNVRSTWRFQEEMQFVEFGDATRNSLYDFEMKLISEVRKNPELYDHTDGRFLVREKSTQRILLWKKIAKKLESKSQICSTTWYRLKRGLMASLLRADSGGGKWRFSDEMSFIVPILKDKVENVKKQREGDKKNAKTGKSSGKNKPENSPDGENVAVKMERCSSGSEIEDYEMDYDVDCIDDDIQSGTGKYVDFVKEEPGMSSTAPNNCDEEQQDSTSSGYRRSGRKKRKIESLVKVKQEPAWTVSSVKVKAEKV